MVKRSVSCPDTEPEQKTFELPSEKEHLFQVVDFITPKVDKNDDTMLVKCEVVGGEEEGRSLIVRCSLDESFKGFFATRLFLKAISLPHKGQFEIDTDEWIGRQFYATVVHNGQYANIKEYNFEKVVEQTVNPGGVTDPQKIAWEE